jgi:hypothetical protein
MKKIKLLLGGFLLLITCQLSAQDNKQAKAETERLTKLMHQLEGTYQVQAFNAREVAFPLSALDMVEAKRKDEDTVYFWIGSNVRVMVLPRNEINKKDFIPVSRMGAVTGAESK